MPYKKLIPKLYRDGYTVRLKDNTITTILFSVTLSETLLCPHCGKELHITSAFGSAYSYFTTTPLLEGDCCRPLQFFELTMHHNTTDYLTYDEMLSAIKQDYEL